MVDLTPVRDASGKAGPSRVRFEFGKNWQRFLRYLDEDRIIEAEKSLCSMLEVDTLAGKSFLDIGCGSGLSSLAAMRLGASRVRSFDYDEQSVACTLELKRRYFPASVEWTIAQGSALDRDYLASLGTFDVVYSWGVLHHTGDLWRALEYVAVPLAPGGKLFIAVYNDCGLRARFWRAIKRLYCSQKIFRIPIIAVFGGYVLVVGFVKDCVLLRNPFHRYTRYRSDRGMSFFTDLLDWLGGYPYEVARPEQVVNFFRPRGFQLVKQKHAGQPIGNNEFVFVASPAQDDRRT